MWLLSLPASLVSTGLSTFGVMIATMTAAYVLVGLDEVGMGKSDSFNCWEIDKCANCTFAF